MMYTASILDPVQATLPPDLWDEPASPKPVLKPRHARWITHHVYDVLERHGYQRPHDWLNPVLTGSLTTYQYGPDSDCDVSLFVNSDVLPEWSRAEMIGLMIENTDGVVLPGTNYPMQCYVVGKKLKPTDLYKPGLRSGYDIAKHHWIVPPERSRVHNVEQEQNGFYVTALEWADKMERLLRYEPDKAVQFWHMIHKRRMRDQQSGKGDFSEANIIYKFLAHRGLLPQIAETSGEHIAMAADPHWLDHWIQRNGPYAYHRTPTWSAAQSITRTGLLPWDHPANTSDTQYVHPDEDGDGLDTSPGYLQPRANHVYLTSKDLGNRPHVRIDLRKLNPERLNPDEDAMAYGVAKKLWGFKDEMYPPVDADNYHDYAFENRGDWANQQQMKQPSQTAWSLEHNNTLAHNGAISPDAIEIPHPGWEALDPDPNKPWESVGSPWNHLPWQNLSEISKTAEQRGWTDFYHVSPRSNRESIQNLGLMGENGTSSWGDPWQRGQPYGNYMFANPEDAQEYTHVLRWQDKQGLRADDEDERWGYPEPPEDIHEWPDEQQDEWYDNNGPVERTEDPGGYDVWKVNTRGLPIHRDPESSLSPSRVVQWTPQKLRQEYEDRSSDLNENKEWENQLVEHTNYWGTVPNRFYTPENVEPQRLQLHQHYPRWEIANWEDQTNDENAVPNSWDEMLLRRPQFPSHSKVALVPGWRPITQDEARGNSRPVSLNEFMQLAAEGKAKHEALAAHTHPTIGLDNNWDTLKEHAYQQALQPWGGVTIDSHTGQPLDSAADRYALTVRPPDMNPVSVPENPAREDFHAAMDRAKTLYQPLLERQNHHLGVFHDNDEGRIDIDPVLVVDNPRDVESIGAYTHATGGAYHFATGNGYFPPHVAETEPVGLSPSTSRSSHVQVTETSRPSIQRIRGEHRPQDSMGPPSGDLWNLQDARIARSHDRRSQSPTRQRWAPLVREHAAEPR